MLLCRPYSQTTRAEYMDAVRYLESVRGLAPLPPEAELSLHNANASIDEAPDKEQRAGGVGNIGFPGLSAAQDMGR